MAGNHESRLVVVGANHRSSTARLRERLFVDSARLPALYGALRQCGVANALVLSTCDRVEVQATHEAPADAARRIRKVLMSDTGVGASEAGDQVYALFEEDALRHVFAVAASLDSQVVGESQVLGQVRESHREAAAQGMMGEPLDGVLRAAYRAAKRVRTETTVGHRPISLASCAVQLSRDVHGDVSRLCCLVVGLGDMGELIGTQLQGAGIERVLLAAPARRTEAVAQRRGVHFVPFEGFRQSLKSADIVVASAGTGRYLLDDVDMRRALAARRRRPMVVFDTGVPADVDPAVDALDGVFMFTLEDLERVAQDGRSSRGAAATDAWRIVEEEVAAWRTRTAARTADPAIVGLRQHFEGVRREVLAELPGASAEEATRLLVNRLLHRPSRALRARASGGAVADVARDGPKPTADHESVLRELFGIADEREG